MSAIPFGNETVTLVRRTEAEDLYTGRTVTGYTACTLTGCSWRRTARIIRDGEALIGAEGITCRVPVGQAMPRAGDLMILGDVAVTVTSGADFQRLIEQYRDSDGAFVVASVKDNARPGMPMPHYAARA